MAVREDTLIVFAESSQQVLQHLEVRQQDIRRIGGDVRALSLVFLARISLNGDRIAAEVIRELLDLLQLAVRKGVHRINDNRPGALCLIARSARTEHGIYDRDKVGQRLARARTRSHYVTLLGLSLLNRKDLVLEQTKRDGLLALLLDREELSRLWVQQAAGSGELFDILVPEVVRVELEDRLRPEAAFIALLLDEFLDVGSGDISEAGRETAVIRDQPIAKFKDVAHERVRGSLACGVDVFLGIVHPLEWQLLPPTLDPLSGFIITAQTGFWSHSFNEIPKLIAGHLNLVI